MEHGFFHPERGYWQTTGEPSAEILATYPAGTIEVPIKPGADYEWQNGEWVYVPKPEPVPQIISRRQFYQGLAKLNYITKQQAIDAIASGQIPEPIQQIINQIEDQEQQFDATMLIIGATEFYKNHPLVGLFASALQMSEQDVDDFWISCSEL